MARIHQDITVDVPREDAYELWSRVELLPCFLRHLTSAVPLSDELVCFTTEIGRRRQFVARVRQHRPGHVIRWSCAEEPSHQGEITFVEVSRRRTRVDFTILWDPARMSETSGSLFRLDQLSVLEDLQEFKRLAEASRREEARHHRFLPRKSKEFHDLVSRILRGPNPASTHRTTPETGETPVDGAQPTPT
ncbi:SRPBCC family protein [Arthrobacter sp.]|uniref:SRPBCC family protein n=1 Tax=Arthrobacter sp. TaxID=1667 RepID=UPI00258502B0|nr:SRPBCC family protein [Arthrobacter sp.]